jgi:hypothetical protein
MCEKREISGWAANKSLVSMYGHHGRELPVALNANYARSCSEYHHDRLLVLVVIGRNYGVSTFDSCLKLKSALLFLFTPKSFPIKSNLMMHLKQFLPNNGN